MKLSKYFLKHYSFFQKKVIKNLRFLKSKNSSQPFRQSLYNFALTCFFSKNFLFDNIKFYKNFDLFNFSYYVFFTKQQVKGIH